MIERVRAERDPAAVIDRLVHATNEHDPRAGRLGGRRQEPEGQIMTLVMPDGIVELGSGAQRTSRSKKEAS